MAGRPPPPTFCAAPALPSPPPAAARHRRPAASLASRLPAAARRLAAAAAGAGAGRATPADLADPDSLFADVDGVRVHYKLLSTAGPAPAAPPRELFLAVHGFGANLSTFSAALPALLARRPAPAAALAFDSPGFGLTSRPPLTRLSAFRARFGARIVAALLPRAAPPPVVVGFSIGARTALAYAAAAADRGTPPRALVLIAPGVPPAAAPAGARGRAERAARAVGAALRAGAALLLVAVSLLLQPLLVLVLRAAVCNVGFWVRGLRLARGDPATLRSVDVDAYRRPLAVQQWDTGILNFTRAMALEQSSVCCLVTRVRLACPGLPCLIVHGAKDRLIPLSNSEAIVRQLPGASLVVVPGLGHVLHEEDPDGFARIVDDWLASLPSGAAT